MGGGPLDAIWGEVVVLLIWLFRKRLARVTSAIGVLGTTLAVMAISIFLGGALFALGWMPGPAFTVGAVSISIVILVVQRRTSGRRLVPRLPFPRRLDRLILLGVVTGAAGLAIAIHAAWITDIADVNAILRAVT